MDDAITVTKGNLTDEELGALVAVFLMTQLDGTALLIGAIWLAVGVGILAKITRGFKVAPPEMAV